ncbi:MAG: type III-A CRISPR-associated RAMP protein Csm4 [bacterium]|nr:type III-A CRISPR-associated RAMP protein Csm4 [bacterium]
MKIEVIKLFKEGPILLHIGLRRMDRTSITIHSDTLFSALSNSLIKLFGNREFGIFEERIVLSSVFPGLRGISRDILFLPMPNIPLKGENLPEHKRYKKLQWISLEALKELIECFDANSKSINSELLKGLKFLNSNSLVTRREFEEIQEEVNFLGTILEPKVSLSRETQESNLFFQENLELHTIKTSSYKKLIPFLYFLRIKDKELDSIFIPTLNLFIEEGLGGERTTGKGIFDFYEREELELPDNGDFEITLSLTLPRKEEVDKLIYYQLVKRDGFIYYQRATGLRKRTHYKIREGSLVKSPYLGENINVSPREDMRVISYGRSIGFKFS